MKPFFIFLLLFITSCSAGVPKGIIKPPQMQAIIYDLVKADEFVVNYKLKDSTLDRKKESMKMYEQVFLIHKVSRSDFYKSYNYYQEHPDKNKVVFDSLYQFATRKKNLSSPIKPIADTSIKKK